MFKRLKRFKDKISKSGELSDHSSASFRGIMGGEILNTSFVRKQSWLILLLVGLAFVYTGNRYYCERQLAHIDKLQKKLQSVKYTYLTISSDLMKLSRQSQVEELIKSKNLKLEDSTTPPFVVESD